MSTEPFLLLANVTRAYRAGVPGCGASIDVLRGVSLDVQPGDLTVIEAAPGAGKTTLLLCAAGLLRPDSGAVQWPAFASRTTQAPKEVRYVGDRATTYGFLTVRESLAYARTLREIDEPRAPALEDDPLEMAGLRELTGTRVALLSRSERARFLVALALVSAPKLFLVDDLTSGCDAAASADFSLCMSRVARSGAAVLWATRMAGPLPPGCHAYELVRGKLRERSGSTPATDPTFHPPGDQGLRPHAPAAQRVAEP